MATDITGIILLTGARQQYVCTASQDPKISEKDYFRILAIT